MDGPQTSVTPVSPERIRLRAVRRAGQLAAQGIQEALGHTRPFSARSWETMTSQKLAEHARQHAAKAALIRDAEAAAAAAIQKRKEAAAAILVRYRNVSVDWSPPVATVNPKPIHPFQRKRRIMPSTVNTQKKLTVVAPATPEVAKPETPEPAGPTAFQWFVANKFPYASPAQTAMAERAAEADAEIPMKNAAPDYDEALAMLILADWRRTTAYMSAPTLPFWSRVVTSKAVRITAATLVTAAGIVTVALGLRRAGVSLRWRKGE